jgi:septum formation protein
MSGRRHKVFTAVSVIDGKGKQKTVVVTSVVRFKRLTPADIDGYIKSGEWKGKAGGYAIQGRAAAFIPFISGSYTNIVGLPMFETLALLKAAGR